MFADLFDWLQAEVPARSRPYTGTQRIRVEDCLEDGQYVLRDDLPSIDP